MEPREKSSLGIDVDLACVVCYIGGPLTGGLMLLLERRDLLMGIATIALFAWIVPAAWRLERKRLPIVGKLADRWIPDDGRAESYKITRE